MSIKKYVVTLTDDERTQLEQLLRGGKAATRKVTRPRILLKAAESLTAFVTSPCSTLSLVIC